jgi:hypothetical protein
MTISQFKSFVKNKYRTHAQMFLGLALALRARGLGTAGGTPGSLPIGGVLLTLRAEEAYTA